MTTHRVSLQPAFVLHSRPYRDTSLLVELFTEQFGRLTVVARGARSMKSKLRGILAPFLPLLVSFSGKSDLRTLEQAEMSRMSYALERETLLSGFYLNELLMKLLPIHEAYPEVYQAYQQTLINLTNSKQPELALRIFEKSLLTNLGYGLQLGRTIHNEVIVPDQQYIFEFGRGLQVANVEGPLNFLGQSLLALHTGNLNTINELRDAKRLLRGVLAVLLDHRSIKSRELFVPLNRSS